MNMEACTGCAGCILACSFAKSAAFSYAASRIRVRKNEEFADFRPQVYVQCAETPCITICPVNALSRNNVRWHQGRRCSW